MGIEVQFTTVIEFLPATVGILGLLAILDKKERYGLILLFIASSLWCVIGFTTNQYGLGISGLANMAVQLYKLIFDNHI